MIIRKIQHEDLDAVAAIHLMSYPADHFSSFLGKNLLIRFYHQITIDNPLSFVAVLDLKITGFLISGTNTGDSVRKFLKRNFFPVAFTLALHPEFWVSRIMNFFRILRKKPTPSKVGYRIMSIAVDPGVQKEGVGKQLFLKLEEFLIKKGINEYGLSVKISNTKAVQFYHKMGMIVEFEKGDTVYFRKMVVL